MRRPTLCSDVHTVDDTYLNAAQGTTPVDKEGRLSKVKRMLADSLLLGRRATSSSCSKHFGVPLDEVALTKEGVPVVISKICSYLENNGLQCESLFQSSAANPKLADRLRTTLDLESANDVFTTALLLKIWLKELPEPIVWGQVATELLSTHGKVSEESVGTWRQAIRIVLCTLPETNLRLLRYILRFLHRYNHHQLQRSSRSNAHSMINHLGSVFAPLLILRGLDYYGAEQLSRANILTSRLIQDHASIFHQWLLDHPNEVTPKSTNTSPSNSHKKNKIEGIVQTRLEDAENTGSGQHRKRKERNESANSNQSLERKVIRSSSEERHLQLSLKDNKNESIRRVSSHEDFRHAKHQIKASAANRFTTVVELSDQPQNVRFSGLPLQECNHIDTSVISKDQVEQSLHESYIQQKENELQRDQQQMLKFRDRSFAESLEDEHEKRRSSERVSRSLIPSRSVARRNMGRKKRVHQTSTSSAGSEDNIDASVKERDNKRLPRVSDQAVQDPIMHYHPELPYQYSVSSEERDDDAEPEAEVESLSDESRPGSSHSFLQLHPPERERSPSPSISPCTPPLDLTTLHQSVDGSEPVASRVGWDFVRPQNQDDSGRGLLLSPRNSMILTRRIFTDHNVPPSPPGDHHGSCLPGPALDLENLIKKLNKQIASIKKKLKRYEEGFEREFGYRPSQSDKMANKDIKKMCLDLSRLRKELKQIKENPLSAMASQTEVCLGSSNDNVQVAFGGNFSSSSFEETIAEVERRLKERRRSAGRPESMDEMTPEEHSAEKLAMQKALLMLEKVCGRATSKQDREIVRPLYDRYRQLKRTVSRAASSKLKDSINELATIHEHEAMDFTPLTSVLPAADVGMDALSQPTPQGSSAGSLSSCSSSTPSGTGVVTGVVALQTQPSVEEASDSQTSSSDSLGENLHALPLSDLVLQLTQTREEKKKLRRLLREQEEVFQQQTGRRMQREDRLTLSGDLVSKDYSVMYSSYKQVKAKLRLLEALVAKQR